jgi:Tfp pilus assembly protein PilF/TolB-like protein
LKRILTFLLLLILPLGAALAQSTSATSQTLLVLPFENSSKAPGLEWIGESFPEVLGGRMRSASLYIVPREDRTYAFDHAGIPANLHPSHATLFRIGEELDVDYMVWGHYGFDGQTLSAEARILDVKHLQLSAPINESGPLNALISIQAALAWDLLKSMNPAYEVTRNEFLADSPPIRLDAFECYIRGLVATSRTEKIRKFREALRVNPTYTQAQLQLGRTYFSARDYEPAAAAFARIPRSDPAAREASFYAGLAYYYSGEFEKAESAFSYLASLFPLTEVYNNLGVVEARRGKKNPVEYFQKAVQADDHDADYRFNVGLTLYKAGDSAGAARQLQEALKLRPGDSEARGLLDLSIGKTDASSHPRLPQERIKGNYDESSFRQLAMEIQNMTETRLANTDPHAHAAYHVEHGHDLLERRFVVDAGRQFREAIGLDPNNAAAHAGLAAVLEASNDPAGARREANIALGLQPLAEAYLVLARLDLRDNNPQAAAANVEHVLALQPANAAAAALKRTVAEKLGEGAQAKP